MHTCDVMPCSRNALTYEECASLMDSVMYKVLVEIMERLNLEGAKSDTIRRWCVHKDIMSLEEKKERPGLWFVRALEFLVDRIHALRVSVYNTKLRIMAPAMRVQGMEFMRLQFQKHLQNGTFTLDIMKRWLQEAVKTADASMMQGLGSGDPSCFSRFVTMASVDLVHTCFKHGQEDKVPETLGMDAIRLFGLHNRMHSNIMEMIILVTLEEQGSHMVGMQQGLNLFQLLRTAAKAIRFEKPSMEEPALALEVVIGILLRYTSF